MSLVAYCAIPSTRAIVRYQKGKAIGATEGPAAAPRMQSLRGGVNNYMIKLHMFVRDLMGKLTREEGQTSVEYALVLSLVAIVLATALGLGLSGALDTVITSITNALS
jgi:Flp pilus assembly pilin Flp